MKKVKYLILGLVACLCFAGYSFALSSRPLFDLSSVENNSNYSVVYGPSYSFRTTGAYMGLSNFGLNNGETISYFYAYSGESFLYNQFSSDLTSFHPYYSYLNYKSPNHLDRFINYDCPVSVYDFIFLIGNGPNFGSFYFSKGIPLTLSTTLCSTNGPIFNVGGLFNSNSNYSLLSYDTNYPGVDKYFRFFYTGDISGINLVNPSSGTVPKFWAWESLTNTGADTNFGSFTESTHDIYKYTHFGLYSMGYSFIYKSSNTDVGTISWDTLKFATVSDLIEVPLKLGDTSDLHGFAFGGILVLPQESYHSAENLGQYLLAKDPNDPTQIMYEIYSCQNSYVPAVLNQSGGCIKLDGGYLTQAGGSRNVLPFSTFTNTVDISTYLESFPFLNLISTNLSTHDIISSVSTVGNTTLVLSNNLESYNFVLDSDSSVDFKSMFESDLPVPTYSGSGNIFNNCVDTEVCRYDTGSNGEQIRYCTTRCITTGAISSGSYIGADGTIYYVNSTLDIDSLINGNNDLIFDDSYLDSGGFVSLDYYLTLFESPTHFKFGRCPYPVSDVLGFATRFKIGNFYPFMPLNCFISAFQQGSKIHYFDDFGLFPDLDSQLIHGDTHFHKTLFRFFDLLLSFGIFLLLSALHRLIRK